MIVKTKTRRGYAGRRRFRMKRNEFSPSELMRAYLNGEVFSHKAQRIIRNAVYNLLMLGWKERQYPELPKLVVAGELSLMDLPYLDDREKYLLIKQFLEYRHGSRLCVQDRQVFHEWIETEDCGNNPKRVREAVNLTVKDIDEHLRGGVVAYRKGNHKHIPPYDIHSLRVCTLLYRPFVQWTAEEHAIMRGSIKVSPKSRQQKFYRSW